MTLQRSHISHYHLNLQLFSALCSFIMSYSSLFIDLVQNSFGSRLSRFTTANRFVKGFKGSRFSKMISNPTSTFHSLINNKTDWTIVFCWLMSWMKPNYFSLASLVLHSHSRSSLSDTKWARLCIFLTFMENFLCRKAITGSRKHVFMPEAKGHRKWSLSPTGSR